MVTRRAPNERLRSSMTARLPSFGEHEKMSMFTVPVSGHVCNAA
jgi:hypothetical protein